MDRDLLTFVILVAGFVASATAGVIRYALLPYLREQLQLSRETHQQVTDRTSHTQAQPTLRDDLGEVRAELADVREQLRDNTSEVSAVGRMFDGHLDASEEYHSRLQRQVDDLWAALRARHHHTEEGHPE